MNAEMGYKLNYNFMLFRTEAMKLKHYLSLSGTFSLYDVCSPETVVCQHKFISSDRNFIWPFRDKINSNQRHKWLKV